MNMVPLDDKVIVRRDDAEEKSPGGIVLPDVSKERPRRGRVLAVGPGKMLKDGTRSQMPITEGDRVVFGQTSGWTMPGDPDLVVLQIDSILAKLV